MSNTESGYYLAGYGIRELSSSGLLSGGAKKVAEKNPFSSTAAADKRIRQEAKKINDRVLEKSVLGACFRDGDLDWVAIKEKKLDEVLMELKHIKAEEAETVELMREIKSLTNRIGYSKDGADKAAENDMWKEYLRIKEKSATLAREGVPRENGDGGAGESSSSPVLGSKGPSLLEEYLRRQREIVQSWQALLEGSERAKEEAARLEREKRRELQKTLHELRNFEEKEASEKQVLGIIHRALEELDRLKRKWEQLLVYFTDMDALVQGIMGDALRNFTRITIAAKKQLESKSGGRDEAAVAREVPEVYRRRLLQKARLAAETSVVLELMAGTFTYISEAHLKPLVDEFPSYLSLDGERDRGRIRKKRVELDSRVKKAEADIQRRVKEARGTFVTRMEEQKRIVGDMLPALRGPEE